MSESPPALTNPPRSFGHNPALDGLRGLAVAGVVLYHFAPALLPGGFLGVDVFFVLSGFLLTSLILVEHHNTSTVSLGSFWNRRFRRLLPAALATILVCVALSWLLEPPSTRVSLRPQALASIVYGANWWSISSNSSYESAFGKDSPLTHFWSLAVEEQFYVLFPIIVILAIVLIRRRSGSGSPNGLARTLLVVSLGGALASALAMALMYQPGTDPSRVYLGSDTHLYAILVGVFVGCLGFLRPPEARVDNQRSQRALAVVALLALFALVAAFVLAGFHQEWLYSGGLFAVSLVTGALIWSLTCIPTGAAHRLLGPIPLRKLGIVSYGVYLWHWPARAFLTTERTGLDGFALFSLRLAAPAAATTLSVVLIERPFRVRRKETGDVRTRNPFPARTVLGFAGSALAVAVVCVMLTIPESANGSVSTAAPPPSSNELTVTGPRPVRVLWLGDSVAWTIAGGEFAFPQPSTFVSAFDGNRITLWNQSLFGLQLMRWPSRRGDQRFQDCATCEPHFDLRAAVDEFQPDIVTFSASLNDADDHQIDGNWVTVGSAEYEARYLAALEQLRLGATSQGATLVLVIQPGPSGEPNDWPNDEKLDQLRFHLIGDLYRSFARTHPGVEIIDLASIVCPSGECIARTPDGKTIRADGIHFTDAGAHWVTPMITGELERIRQPIG